MYFSSESVFKLTPLLVDGGDFLAQLLFLALEWFGAVTLTVELGLQLSMLRSGFLNRI